VVTAATAWYRQDMLSLALALGVTMMSGDAARAAHTTRFDDRSPHAVARVFGELEVVWLESRMRFVDVPERQDPMADSSARTLGTTRVGVRTGFQARTVASVEDELD